MDTPFIYDKYVTGKNFIGRRSDCMSLGNLIANGEHVAIYEPPKSGKMSLIQQSLFDLRLRGNQFAAGQFSLLNVRTIKAFLLRLGTTVLRTVASTPDEFGSLVDRHLAGTHFAFDRMRFSEADEVVGMDGEVDDNDIAAMLRLPQKVAREMGKQLIVIISEFQNLDLTEDGERVYKVMEKVLGETKDEPKPGVSFILCGSMVNAMKNIFEVRKFFYRVVEHFPIKPVETRDIIEHIVRGFLASGKVIERELLLGVCRLFRNNMWYINHLIAICDSMSRGYVVESMLTESLDRLISINEPRMIATMNGLTTFQVSLLRAILDGNVKFSAAEVIKQYSLNSSANVKRLKDALMKKEIVTFGENDEAEIIDPLFEYWVRKYYFEME